MMQAATQIRLAACCASYPHSYPLWMPNATPLHLSALAGSEKLHHVLLAVHNAAADPVMRQFAGPSQSPSGYARYA